MPEAIDKFRNPSQFNRFLSGQADLLDPEVMLALYYNAISAERRFVKERVDRALKFQKLQAAAKELGGEIGSVVFDKNSPTPLADKMAELIEQFRKAYLAALFYQNFSRVIEAADAGQNGMTHIVEDENRCHDPGYGTPHRYSLRHDYIEIECDEELGEDCFIVQSDMEIFEWKGSGYDRDGDWNDTGFPSKWDNHHWRIPRTVSVVTDLVWSDAQVPCDPYPDFRTIFFPLSCGGTWHGGSYSESIYPRPWDYFQGNLNDMQHNRTLASIGWDSEEHVTKITLSLPDDGNTAAKKEE